MIHYTLVNLYITHYYGKSMNITINHHFQWENSLFRLGPIFKFTNCQSYWAQVNPQAPQHAASSGNLAANVETFCTCRISCTFDIRATVTTRLRKTTSGKPHG